MYVTVRVDMMCIHMLTLYFTLTLYVNIVFYGCLNIEIPTASLIPILTDFVDFLPALYKLVRNTFVPIFRNICPRIWINNKVARFG